jgi:hypothetical protein
MRASKLLVVALVAGCYQQHTVDSIDAGVDAGSDAGEIDLGTDAGPGFDAAGLPPACLGDDVTVGACATSECGIEHCSCLLESPSGGVCAWTVGVGAPPCRVETGCLSDGLCADFGALSRGDEFTHGMCASQLACAHLLANGSDVRCLYQDGSFFGGGTVPVDECAPGFIGILCGPSCGACDEGSACFGVSERSGIGLCLRADVLDAPNRCGLNGRSQPRALCLVGERCLRFNINDGVPPGDLSGLCIESTSCELIASTHPERFECGDG